MGYYVKRLKRPFNYQVMIESYIYTQRNDFVHPDFRNYYVSLIEALQPRFGIRLSLEGLTFDQRVLWMLFNSTIRSLLQITNPWAGYLEAGLLHTKLKQAGEPGEIVERASEMIGAANSASEAAHRDILYALFRAIYGDCQLIVTSEELRATGFDDSKEPDGANYFDYM